MKLKPGTCQITPMGGGSLIVCGELCSVADQYRWTDEYRRQRARVLLKARKLRGAKKP